MGHRRFPKIAAQTLSVDADTPVYMTFSTIVGGVFTPACGAPGACNACGIELSPGCMAAFTCTGLRYTKQAALQSLGSDLSALSVAVVVFNRAQQLLSLNCATGPR
jgi:hypothetical protein